MNFLVESNNYLMDFFICVVTVGCPRPRFSAALDILLVSAAATKLFNSRNSIVSISKVSS